MGLPVASGDVIGGKYRVERMLGAGGMGVVFAARHLALGERVAIKLLLSSRSASADAVARFLREGRAAARIRSGHVARVYDVGTLPSGEPYMIMEYLAGRDLGAVLRDDGPLSVPAVIDALLQTAEALAVAHASGIVHRDLKPSNLFVTKDLDGSPVIKVIDFGISKDLRAAAQADAPPHVTRSSVVMGSPHYMPPEQMRSARNADARSDIWALGAILYCLLTGRPPFAGESIAEIYDSMLAGPPKIRDARPDVPEELDEVLGRCLERDPAARYPDVAAFAEAIAPHGPADARARAARVARIVAAGAHADEPSLPPDPCDVTLQVGEAASSETGDTVPASGPPATSTGAPRDPSWDVPASEGLSESRTGTNSPVVDGPRLAAAPPPRPWRTLLAVAAAAALGAAVTVAVQGSRDGPKTASDEAAAAPPRTEAAPAAAPPAIETAAAPEPSSSTTATASASAAPPPSTLAPSAGPGPTPPRPPSAPNATSAPKAAGAARAPGAASTASAPAPRSPGAAPASGAASAAPAAAPSIPSRPDPLADPN